MRTNKEIFLEVIEDYKKQKYDYEEKLKVYEEAHDAWSKKLETNGDWMEDADSFGKKLDKVTSDLDKSRKEYNALAHQALRFYC